MKDDLQVQNKSFFVIWHHVLSRDTFTLLKNCVNQKE